VIVIASRPGQLGNLLFVFAHFVGFAIEKGGTILDPAFSEYAGAFENLRGRFIPSYPAIGPRMRGSRWVATATYWLVSSAARALARSPLRAARAAVVSLDWGERLDLGGAEFAALAKRRLLLVTGWEFRYPEAVRRQARAIREFFAPRADIGQRAREVSARARAGCDVLVGVHVRQGDYRLFEGGRYFFPAAEYRRVMAATAASLGSRRVGFLVCSNEPQDPGAWAGLSCTPGSGDAVEDLFALAYCDYLVGPPSTYSLWASFWGDLPLHQMTGARDSPTFRRPVEY